MLPGGQKVHPEYGKAPRYEINLAFENRGFAKKCKGEKKKVQSNTPVTDWLGAPLQQRAASVQPPLGTLKNGQKPVETAGKDAAG